MEKQLILFVHGLGGDARATWGEFETFVRADPELRTCQIEFFGYPTSLFRLPFSKRYPKVQVLADAVRAIIENRYPNHENIILVCHSLGGLVARKYLLEEVKHERKLRVAGLLLYAVPNNGAGLATVAQHVSWRHNQLRQLCKDSDLLRELNEDWFTFKVGDLVKVRYVVAAMDRVVDEISARAFWGNPDIDTIVDCGHVSVVKPRAASDLSFLIMRRFVLSLRGPIIPQASKLIEQYSTPALAKPRVRAAGARYRVIAFDLDGTLLRGFDFSWTVVWKHLNFPEAVWKAGMHSYLNGKTTYDEWCQWACAQYRTKGLKRSHFKTIAKDLKLTNNFNETLTILRNSGFITAILSGGIDVILRETIPNADELFDYICINRLQFDDQDVISGAIPTPFDFAGKAIGLEAICHKHGVKLSESVFVGEGFNDECVAGKAGLTVAYPPKENAFGFASRVEIKEDNLLKVLDHVL